MTQEEQNEKKMIMIAEDDAFIGDIYEVKLKDAGFDVVLANNGRDAIEKLESGVRPHIILLDIVMPYMDGFDVLEAINNREEWKEIPIVLLTNLSQKEDVDRGMSLGAKDYLIKSHFTPTEVLSKVEKYIL
ncbi:MAG: response regulator [Candidatus Moraniibacteriota bacterium]|nr:MAG: response regulator [Candidatus Moranbacteria bacterium]